LRRENRRASTIIRSQEKAGGQSGLKGANSFTCAIIGGLSNPKDGLRQERRSILSSSDLYSRKEGDDDSGGSLNLERKKGGKQRRRRCPIPSTTRGDSRSPQSTVSDYLLGLAARGKEKIERASSKGKKDGRRRPAEDCKQQRIRIIGLR